MMEDADSIRLTSSGRSSAGGGLRRCEEDLYRILRMEPQQHVVDYAAVSASFSTSGMSRRGTDRVQLWSDGGGPNTARRYTVPDSAYIRTLVILSLRT